MATVTTFTLVTMSEVVTNEELQDGPEYRERERERESHNLVWLVLVTSESLSRYAFPSQS